MASVSVWGSASEKGNGLSTMSSATRATSWPPECMVIAVVADPASRNRSTTPTRWSISRLRACTTIARDSSVGRRQPVDQPHRHVAPGQLARQHQPHRARADHQDGGSYSGRAQRPITISVLVPSRCRCGAAC